jgi:hypothetical protein
MAENGVPSREQQVYWKEFVQLKADSCYVRDYRNHLNRWVTGVATIRAVASAGGIAAWAIWKQYAYVWACFIAASQVVDALKNVFPFYKRRDALSRWSRALNRLFVEAQRDWDEIASGKCTDSQIGKLSHQMRLRKERAEAKCIPHGLALHHDLFDEAQKEAARFFASRYDSIVE